MTDGIHSHAEQCNRAPAHFVSSIDVHLKQPSSCNFTKKIQKVPDGSKGDINNVVLRIQVPADNKGLKLIEVEI